jgi:predicted transposase/invertase (TIGR01784 family)
MSTEPVGISPCVDLVFQAIMCEPSTTAALHEFIQAVMAPTQIASITVTNPMSMLEALRQKQIVVDAKAVDSDGRIYQIEMQTANVAGLSARMLYGWAKHYEQQLGEGDDYRALNPVVGVWLLEQNLWRTPGWRHHFTMHDRYGGGELPDHAHIHVFEISKHPAASVGSALDRWLRFFGEAERWASLPEELKTPGLEAAMGVLNRIKANTEARDLVDARREYLRIQLTETRAREEAIQRANEAEAQLEREREDKERAVAEAQREREGKERAVAEANREREERQREREDKERAVAEANREREERQREREDKERAVAEANRALAELAELKRRLGMPTDD